MTEERVKVYVTKYALTKGILEKECVIEGKYYAKFKPLLAYHNFAGAKEWHYTYEEAKEYAEEMRLKKIAPLKKKLAKLEKLRF